MKKRYLVLENGKVFEGKAFGADAGVTGELVFNTGAVGYIELLTDPGYLGQIVVQTFPAIGNYGIIPEDFESNYGPSGYVVREWCDQPSNFRSEGTVDGFLKEKGIPGIYGVDTREITRIIRNEGVMNACICDKLPADEKSIKKYKIKDAVKTVSVKKPYVIPAGSHKYNVTLIDYGAKSSIAKQLTERGCLVRIVPYSSSASDILRDRPDGVVLSNGPGDPSENTSEIKEIKELIGKVPIFAIGLGHQLLAIANGAKTSRLKYGHRGANQPIKDVKAGSAFIAGQNHGYVVDDASIKKGSVSYFNLNDGTCEGIDYDGAFSVQFDPEGPVYDRFIDMMGGGK